MNPSMFNEGPGGRFFGTESEWDKEETISQKIKRDEDK